MPQKPKADPKYTTTHKATGVVLHNAKFRCTSCGKWKPATEFGNLRKMGDGTIRNQSQCIECR